MLLFFVLKTKEWYEKKEESECRAAAEVPQGGGRAYGQTVVRADADGGAGPADGADGEADRELHVSAQHGTVGAEA